MHDYRRDTVIDVDSQRLYAYLSDVGNLPTYFPRMKSAELVGEEEVHTRAVATVDSQQQEVEGTAWFRRDEGAQQVEWGSQGDNDYHGRLTVSPADTGGSNVVLELHTEAGHEGIDTAIDETLKALEDATHTGA